MRNIFWLAIVFLPLFSIAQVSTETTDTLQVSGACVQCKDRIEAAAMLPGVKSAVWSEETKLLLLNFDSTRVQARQVAEAIAKVGHDVGDLKAADKVYDKLPDCCHYRTETHTEMEEVTVSSRQRSSFVDPRNSFRTAVITRKELLKAACCNLSESFETNPSVDVAYNDAATGSKQIQMLGLAGNYTQLTVENLPGPRGLGIALGLNTIPGPWVQSIHLIKGAGSVVNGFESMAGQIDVHLMMPNQAEKLYANGYANSMGKTDWNLNLATKVGKKWSTGLLMHADFFNNEIDMNHDGFMDMPKGRQLSLVHRWHYVGEKGLMSDFGIKLLQDKKIGGEIHAHTGNFGIKLNTDRYEAFAKIGYVFPDKMDKSIGLQLSAYQQEINTVFGPRAYSGNQDNAYANLIYQSNIGSEKHQIKTGLSFTYDRYRELTFVKPYNRTETTPGVFAEYTWKPQDKLDVVAGLRADDNNLYGGFVTPRLHIRYQPFANTTIRGSFGRGQRTANIFAENLGSMVSNRLFQIAQSNASGAYGLSPEISWNKGITVDHRFHLFNREASIAIDYFRNDFQDQVVIDMETPGVLKIYNLDGRSFSNSLQAELNLQPIDKAEIKLAYRWFDVQTEYSGQLRDKPLLARNRAFANLAYEWKGFKFDYTVNWNGPKRIPATAQPYKLSEESPSFVLMNAQINKSLLKNKTLDLYIGGENLTGYFQPVTILAADQSSSPYFDGSLVWGPVTGRNLYFGFRYWIK